jgi:flagellar basal-body rod modification protein FlgD
VTIRSEQVQLAGKPVDAGFKLQNASADVTLVLTGADGAQRRVALGRHAAGDVRFSIDPAKLGLLPGRYAMRIETDTHEAPPVEVSGEISSVKLSAAGKVLLDVANVGEVTPDLIAQYNGRMATPSN